MNWKTFILGVSAGLIGGYAAKGIIVKKVNVSPEKVLEYVKNRFKQYGPIQGSWIHMEVQDYEKHPIQYRVYKGGISRIHNDKNEQFEFVADASTGTILEITKLSVDVG